MTVTGAGRRRPSTASGGCCWPWTTATPRSPLLDLEGLKEWQDGRTSGYAALEAAVEDLGFYDRKGAITAGPDYRP